MTVDNKKAKRKPGGGRKPSKLDYNPSAILQNALLEEGIETWLFECKSYTAGIGRGTIGQMNQLFAMAYMDSPREHGIKVSVVVNHSVMLEQARDYYAGYKISEQHQKKFEQLNENNQSIIDQMTDLRRL